MSENSTNFEMLKDLNAQLEGLETDKHEAEELWLKLNAGD
jgi:hypothetical protein